MIKKIVKYKDFNGVEQEDEFYFHLTKGDLIDMASEEDGSLVDRLTSVSKETDPIKIIPIMKKILINSYGIKSPDGKAFIKDPDEVKNFKYSQAFSELYIELSTDADKAVEFIEGILPDFDEETQKAIDKARKDFEKELEEAEEKNA